MSATRDSHGSALLLAAAMKASASMVEAKALEALREARLWRLDAYSALLMAEETIARLEKELAKARADVAVAGELAQHTSRDEQLQAAFAVAKFHDARPDVRGEA